MKPAFGFVKSKFSLIKLHRGLKNVSAHFWELKKEKISFCQFPHKIVVDIKRNYRLRTSLSTTVYVIYYTTFGGYSYQNASTGYWLNLSGTQPALLIVPTGSVDDYKVTQGWNKIKSYQETDF